MALRNFILEERNSSTGQANITKWDPLTWPVNDTCSEPGPKYSFSLDVKYFLWNSVDLWNKFMAFDSPQVG